MTTITVPGDVLRDVQGVIAGAIERIRTRGWRRYPVRRGRAGGARLVDALNYSSTQAMADRATHVLAFACVAMAIELHTGGPAHELLPGKLADLYLDPIASDDTLHRLDASIVVRYNAEHCNGASDALDLLRVAFDNAEQVIAAQLRAALDRDAAAREQVQA